jgi:hypothetical protein
MSKNRIKSLRNITVDNQEYKWSCVDGFKIWKDKKLVYEGGWYNREKYPEVFYVSDGGITPGIVAKVIRQINGTEDVYSAKDLKYRFENEGGFGIGYYSKNDTFDDKKAEKLWVEFNCKYEEFKKYLEENVKDEQLQS